MLRPSCALKQCDKTLWGVESLRTDPRSVVHKVPSKTRRAACAAR
jgi:hypothetical protein